MMTNSVRCLILVWGLFINAAALAAGDVGDSVDVYARLALSTQQDNCDPSKIALDVATDALEVLDADKNDGERVLYRMNFNQVTEGWNWHPEASREGRDYYQYKFLPLASMEESRGSYRGEDKIGEIETFKVTWRYDYFFAFDNLYDFIERHPDDDAGFLASLHEKIPRAQVGMRIELRLKPPCSAESTTFWKATHARPVDFTLKKRYLIGDLVALVFFDRQTQRVLVRQEAAQR